MAVEGDPADAVADFEEHYRFGLRGHVFHPMFGGIGISGLRYNDRARPFTKTPVRIDSPDDELDRRAERHLEVTEKTCGFGERAPGMDASSVGPECSPVFF